MDESLANLTLACEKFHKTLASFRRTMTVLYIVLAAFILVGIFDLGVEVGKKLCS